ncbi:MAG TPA: DinB family protein [Bacteroidia bacterium]|nr:DinB family protein [Bacteroidia bacterium]
MDLFSNWLSRLDQIGNSARIEFSELNSRQLNWKETEKNWSIGQCLDHLIKSNEKYFPLLDRLISGKYKMSFWESINPLSSYTGRKMAESLGPKVVKPFISPKLFEPGRSSIRGSIVQDFLQHQQLLTSKISMLQEMDVQKRIVTSPVAGLITFPLKDCLEILTGHEERHFIQAGRVKSAPGFPKV